jgi:hypothetical protein
LDACTYFCTYINTLLSHFMHLIVAVSFEYIPCASKYTCTWHQSYYLHKVVKPAKVPSFIQNRIHAHLNIFTPILSYSTPKKAFDIGCLSCQVRPPLCNCESRLYHILHDDLSFQYPKCAETPAIVWLKVSGTPSKTPNSQHSSGIISPIYIPAALPVPSVPRLPVISFVQERAALFVLGKPTGLPAVLLHLTSLPA